MIDVPNDLLVKLRALAVQKPLTARAPQAVCVLNELVECEGVGYPMASAFLKFIRPTVFPIIDVRAYRALTGTRLRYNDYNTELYLGYVDQVSEIATQLKVPLAIVDEQLYCYDKVKNGKI